MLTQNIFDLFRVTKKIFLVNKICLTIMEKLMRRRNQQKSDFSFSQMVPSISVALR